VLFRSTGALALKGAIDGVGSVTESGGSVSLSGANSYTGGTVVTSGTLKLGNNSALGIGNLSMQNGTALGGVGGPITISNAISLSGTVTSLGGVLTLGGSISGSGSLVQNSADKILVGTDLAGANTYKGSTTVNGGIVVIDNANALPTTTALTIGQVAKVALGADIQHRLPGRRRDFAVERFQPARHHHRIGQHRYNF
jgi:fibronectin-binding autotransporter adhesin